MPLNKSTLAFVVSIAVTACGSEALVAPSPAALTGTWLTTVQPTQPRGSFVRKLEFFATGRYVSRGESRGTYAGVPSDSVISYTSNYGAYTLAGDTLRLVQDSAKGWDLLTGSWTRLGPPGIYIEGPPTDPIVEVSRSQLILNYQVNPGAGYIEVRDSYYRAR